MNPIQEREARARIDELNVLIRQAGVSGVSMMETVNLIRERDLLVRELQNARIVRLVDEVVFVDNNSTPVRNWGEAFIPTGGTVISRGKKKINMKERHLNQEERRIAHNPKPDYIESSRGEVCRNTCTLDISDIVEKIKKVPTKATKS